MNLKEIPIVSAENSKSGDLGSALDKTREIRDIVEDRKLIVFLDYDGTLTPIVERPEDAVLSERMRETLKNLADICTVGILSGRGLEDVQKLVDLDSLIYGGSHGFEISSRRHQNLQHEKGMEFIPILDDAQKDLDKTLDPIEGAHVERKKYSLAVHFRQVPEKDIAAVENKVDEVAAKYEKLHKSRGKKVFDIKPAANWHKGKALLWLINKLEMDRPDVIPVYIGDDTTDEDAFRELNRIGGLGIIVRDTESRPTYARFALENTDEVKDFLSFLIRISRETRDHWSLVYNDFQPEEEGLREALCTLGNGYFATRGACAECSADDTHYPGTYLAGGYNRLVTEVAGRDIENEDLVNIPNWLPVTFSFDEGKNWLDLGAFEILSYCQELDIKSGILYRRVRFKDEENRETTLFSRRFVSMDHSHIAAEEIRITACNWQGSIIIKSALDGTVVNAGVDRYKDLNNRHLQPVEETALSPDSLFLKVRTAQSGLYIAQASKIRIFKNANPAEVTWQVTQDKGYIAQSTRLNIAEKEAISVEKVVSVYTSRDHAISECGLAAKQAIQQVKWFHELSKNHMLAWWQLWRRFTVEFDFRAQQNSRTGLTLHLYIFHLLQSVSLHTIDLDAGVPARGWHGEAYRGHIFWDELFIFPFLNFRLPEVTRALLLYRYRRLDTARQIAKKDGFRGAMYPWQSGSDGREESQVLHYNPKSGRWLPDNSHIQRHVNIAIAYNIWQYYQVTDDTEFISFYGAEMLLEIARFLASLTSYDKDQDRYEIKHVMGPDEYHDAYPKNDTHGLDNNAYTNVMTAWILCRALKILEALPVKRRVELCKKIDLDAEELAVWKNVSKRLKVIFHSDGVISQFEGFEDLEEFDWKGYKKKYGNIQRLDRILEAEGDTPNRYKLSKQADTLMLFYLLSTEELERIFNRLGYGFDPTLIPKTISYYLKRTSHGSTLSRVVHSWVLARSTRPGSWKLFCEALKSDIDDIQGGTTPEGIHLGAMAGTVDLITRGYTGLEVRDGVLWFNPCLPEEMGSFHMHLRYLSHTLEVDVGSERLVIYIPPSDQPPIKLGCGDEICEIRGGETKAFFYSCSIPVLSPDQMEETVN